MTPFYSIIDKSISGQEWLVNVQLNPTHPVYEGHFPGNPVAPGVMLVNMIKDVIETEKNTTLVLKNARNIKFLNMVTPEGSPQLALHFDISGDDEINCKVDAQYKGESYFKISATFVPSN